MAITPRLLGLGPKGDWALLVTMVKSPVVDQHASDGFKKNHSKNVSPALVQSPYTRNSPSPAPFVPYVGRATRSIFWILIPLHGSPVPQPSQLGSVGSQQFDGSFVKEGAGTVIDVPPQERITSPLHVPQPVIIATRQLAPDGKKVTTILPVVTTLVTPVGVKFPLVEQSFIEPDVPPVELGEFR